MNSKLRPYVALPDFLLLPEMGLQYLDVLVYIGFRYHDYRIDGCFPMHETVGKLIGKSRRFVIDAVKRLERANVITVDRSERKNISNEYYFKRPYWNDRIEKIPKDIFEHINAGKLTSNEMAMLLCIRQFFNHGKYQLAVERPVPYLAQWLGLTEPTVRKQFDILVQKGYINKRFVFKRYSAKVTVRYLLSDKIDWNYDMYNQVTSQTKSSLKVA